MCMIIVIMLIFHYVRMEVLNSGLKIGLQHFGVPVSVGIFIRNLS